MIIFKAEAAERFETWGGGHRTPSQARTPTQISQNVLCVVRCTSKSLCDLNSVQCVRNLFVTMHKYPVVQTILPRGGS